LPLPDITETMTVTVLAAPRWPRTDLASLLASLPLP